MFWLEIEMAFPFPLTSTQRKTHRLAGYAAVQHIAWDVMDVMTIHVSLRSQLAGPQTVLVN
jgi:hypothetical protein